MVWDSSPWRRMLLKNASWFRALEQKTLIAENDLEKLEIKVFVSAYIVRKLVEAEKLKTNSKNLFVKVKAAPRKFDSNLTHLNWHHVERHFDTRNFRKTQLQTRTLINQIIHSFVFQPETDQHGHIKAFFFCSDHVKRKEIFLITLAAFSCFIVEIANSQPSESKTTYCPESGKTTIHNS